jgi:tripartite-type tricarboxylate transporter receptor subunit TctC
VTYKGGSEVVTAVAGGHVMSFLSGIPPALPHIQSGRLRAIGISTKDRVQVLADVPTLAEGGIKGFDIANWFGYFTPAGTARDVIARLNTGVQTAIRDPEVRKVLDRQGIVPLETTPDDFARFTASEARKYAQIIRESGIRIE